MDFRGRWLGWAVGVGGQILHSGNGGRSWQRVRQEQPMFLSRLIRTGDSLSAVGPFGVLKRAEARKAWERLEVSAAASASLAGEERSGAVGWSLACPNISW